jgi:radical SAM superfamily enzyme YgiQ (UPF0313 family)
MKLLLISPSTTPDKKTPTGIMIPQLALYILEALSFPHQVKTVEEETGTIDLEEDCDLIGISCMTANSSRAYFLAQEFRKRGKTVILGGVHPSVLPEEALQYADAVVIGEAEGVWEQVLQDFGNHRLQKKYHRPSPSLDRYLPLNYGKFTHRSLLKFVPIMSTRGCPYSCEFCCVSNLYGRVIRHVPVPNVVRAIQESHSKILGFLDDNIIGKPAYAKELFGAIKPLKIKWAGQASISFVHDTELMKLAADSGCIGLFFGLESVSETQLKTLRKSIKEIKKLEEAIRKVKDLGLHFHASLVFGFDNDTDAVFPETLEFLQRNKISTATINILTPYPGTAVFDQFQQSGRLLTLDWSYYDHNTVVFRPKNMTPYALQSGTQWVKNEFTKISSVLKRLPGNLSHPWIHLGVNSAIQMTRKADEAKMARLKTELFEPAGQPVVQPPCEQAGCQPVKA